jgi:hypothetical protein
VSNIATIRSAIIAALTTPLTGITTPVAINSLEGFQATIRQLPSVGVAYAGERAEPRAQAIGSAKQNTIPAWDVFYAGPGPDPGVTVGHDIFTLLEAGKAALMGLQITAGSMKTILRLAGAELVLENMPAGGLLYVQHWTHWQFTT